MSSGCLEPNPDIAGIGVRVSIYAQAFLSFVPAILFAADGKITRDELQSMKSISVGILITGCALLISAFIQAATFGLSVYHALIVLNLSWINASNCFLYYSAINLSNLHTSTLTTGVKRFLKPATGVPILQFLHVSAMAALGIWVWSKVGVFGSQPECTPHTLYVLFGKSIPVVDNPLRIASIVLYSITALPALNGIYIAVGVWACGLVVLLITLVLARLKIPIHDHKVESLMVYVPMVLYAAAINVLFVVDTELMIQRNAGLTQPGESQWTFGQTLAMLVLFVPLIDIVKEARVLLKGETDPLLGDVALALKRWKAEKGEDEGWQKASVALEKWEREAKDEWRKEREERRRRDKAGGGRPEAEGLSQDLKGDPEQEPRGPGGLPAFIESILKTWADEKGIYRWQKVNEAVEEWKREGQAKRTSEISKRSED